jgi:hypothetical protein
MSTKEISSRAMRQAVEKAADYEWRIVARIRNDDDISGPWVAYVSHCHTYGLPEMTVDELRTHALYHEDTPCEDCRLCL